MTATMAVIDEFEVLDRTGGSGTAMVAARAHNLLNVKEWVSGSYEINVSKERVGDDKKLL